MGLSRVTVSQKAEGIRLHGDPLTYDLWFSTTQHPHPYSYMRMSVHIHAPQTQPGLKPHLGLR